jgi:hypothetical protein
MMRFAVLLPIAFISLVGCAKQALMCPDGGNLAQNGSTFSCVDGGGERHGWTIEWAENGDLAALQLFRHGRADGPRTDFFNGEKRRITVEKVVHYRDGYQYGSEVEWAANAVMGRAGPDRHAKDAPLEPECEFDADHVNAGYSQGGQYRADWATVYRSKPTMLTHYAPDGTSTSATVMVPPRTEDARR